MIAFEVNPTARSIRAVEIPAVPEGYDDNAKYLNDLGDVVYIQKNSESKFGFVLEGIRAPLIGIAYVVGTNEDGDDIPPKVTYDWLVEHSDFGTIVAQGSITMFTGDRIIRQVQ